MKIRQVVPNDYRQIDDFVKTAFATAPVSDGTEQEFVLKLRKSSDFLPALEFIATENEIIIGHIMLTRCYVKGKNKTFTGVLVAPLAVALDHRNRGIGSKLLRYGLAQAVAREYTAAFLVGDPAYYHRFGFRIVSDFNILNDSDIPDQFVQACELIPDSLKDVSGRITIE